MSKSKPVRSVKSRGGRPRLLDVARKPSGAIVRVADTGPTEERKAHAAAAGVAADVDLTYPPSLLAARRLIDAVQLQAAERLTAVARAAGISGQPHCARMTDAPRGTETYRERRPWNAAAAHVRRATSRATWDVVCAVCVYLEPPREVRLDRLREGLDTLAEYFGLVQGARQIALSQLRTVAWQADEEAAA